MEPGLAQLAAMARDEPASLGAVSGFRVARRGIGAVRWLEPTDVRALDVNATVRLSRGSVEVGGRCLSWAHCVIALCMLHGIMKCSGCWQ